MSNLAYKVRVKLGASEFEAEGPEDTVRQQLDHFYIAATQPLAQRANTNQPTNTAGNETTGKHPAAEGNGDGPTPIPDLEQRTTVDPMIINRLFRDESGILVLRVIPKVEGRNGEALLLILWGHYVLRNQLEVPGTELVASIKRSGINLGRVDETLSRKGMEGFVNTGGSGKWRKFYSLTNSGLEHAEEVASHILK
jgi:hypothetical protein